MRVIRSRPSRRARDHEACRCASSSTTTPSPPRWPLRSPTTRCVTRCSARWRASSRTPPGPWSTARASPSAPQHAFPSCSATDGRTAIVELGEVLARLPGLAGLNGPEPVVAPLAGAAAGRPPGLTDGAAAVPAGLAGVAGGRPRQRPPGRPCATATCSRRGSRRSRLRRTRWLGTRPGVRRTGRDGAGRLAVDRPGGRAGVDGVPARARRRQRARRPRLHPAAARGPWLRLGGHSGGVASILAEGAIPVLFTDLANPTSNRIYQRLGYRPVGDRVVVTFVD